MTHDSQHPPDSSYLSKGKWLSFSFYNYILNHLLSLISCFDREKVPQATKNVFWQDYCVGCQSSSSCPSNIISFLSVSWQELHFYCLSCKSFSHTWWLSNLTKTRVRFPLFGPLSIKLRALVSFAFYQTKYDCNCKTRCLNVGKTFNFL